MTRVCVGAALILTLSAVSAKAAHPPCSATASFHPPEAVIGQQVLYRIAIYRSENVDSVDWTEPPSFPGFRVERLPGRPETVDRSRPGADYRVRFEERAVFAQRVGDLAPAPRALRCSVRTPTGVHEIIEPIPRTVLHVRPLPEVERPADFLGLIGPVSIVETVEPRSLRLGESVRVALMLRGAGNLWEAGDPLAEGAFENVEVFRRPPSSTLVPGVRLMLKQHFAYDLVPRKIGTLRIPEIRIPYFDPAAMRYAVATSPAVEVIVTPRESSAPPARRETSTLVPGEPDSAAAPSSVPRWKLAIAATLVGIGIAAALAIRRRPGGDVETALARAEAASATGDTDGEAAALAAALRSALQRLLPIADDFTAAERDSSEQPAAIRRGLELLRDVERARFDPAAASPARASVLVALKQLHSL